MLSVMVGPFGLEQRRECRNRISASCVLDPRDGDLLHRFTGPRRGVMATSRPKASQLCCARYCSF